MIRKIILLLLIFSNLYLFSQEKIPINSDRPDHSEGVFVLPKKSLQAEDGFSFDNGLITNDLMLRYGILKHTEIRLETLFQKENANISVPQLTLSAKQSITQEKGWCPAITAVGYLSKEINTKKSVSVDATLAFEYTLSEKMAVSWNIGINDHFENTLGTAQMVYSPWDALSLFAEYHTEYNSERTLHDVDFGALYILNPDFQIDIAFGKILNENQNLYFSAGISYRFL